MSKTHSRENKVVITGFAEIEQLKGLFGSEVTVAKLL